jgi:uncharacterized protein YxjI
MALRKRHQDETLHFQLRERMFSIGDDYWIEDGSGNKVFRVDGKALRLRDTWVLEDASGKEVARIQEKKLSIRDAITIRTGGQEAKVKKALIGFRDRFHVEMDGPEPDLKVHGNVVDHEYEVERHGRTIAEVSKRWFRLRDTYGVEVRDPQDAVLVLSVAVAVDALAHDHG